MARASAILLVEQRPLHAQTLQSLIEQGIPVHQSKYKWNAADKTRLKAALQLLAANQEQPPRPPGKSPITWLKEEVFSGFGPSEEQIRKMLLNMKSY